MSFPLMGNLLIHYDSFSENKFSIMLMAGMIGCSNYNNDETRFMRTRIANWARTRNSSTTL